MGRPTVVNNSSPPFVMALNALASSSNALLKSQRQTRRASRLCAQSSWLQPRPPCGNTKGDITPAETTTKDITTTNLPTKRPHLPLGAGLKMETNGPLTQPLTQPRN